MKRTEYKGYIIDTDNLGRLYIHDTASQYSEDSDRNLINGSTIKEAKAIIDREIMDRQNLPRGLGLITITEYAAMHGRDPASVRQKALRGGFKTAVKIGRDWLIDKDEPYEDLRCK